MSDENRSFELEDEDEGARPARRPTPAPHHREAPEPETPQDESDVDTRTVRERMGADTPRGDEAVALPESWPGEAFGYPLRGKGPTIIIAVAVVLCLLDMMGSSSVARFPAWILKLLVVFVFVLRGQLRLIGSSAAGHDVPRGYEKALEFSSAAMKPWLTLMSLFLFSLVPGALLIVFEMVEPGLLVLGIGSMYVSVVALGNALEDPRLKMPWNAVLWMVRKPLLCVAGSMGWWILGLSEYAIANSYGGNTALVLFLSVVLRLVDGYALIFSARILGVMGRAWKQ